MKISLAWVFDHIAGKTWRDISVDQLVERFNASTAEIEEVQTVSVDTDVFSFAQVIKETPKSVTVKSFEWNKTYTLPVRQDSVLDGWFLVVQDNDSCRWATLRDLGAQKDGLVPQLTVTQEQVAGAWKKEFEDRDVILEVDNKSLTNRPDMWGHRGFAREIAALFDCALIPEEQLLADNAIKHYATESPATDQSPIATQIKDTSVCDRFATLYINDIAPTPSLLHMVTRLARVDTRSYNMLVDATNYVMYDLGQPMHAFDAEKIGTNSVIVRQARVGEKLELLDDRTIELTESDCVVCAGEKPISLAGIMGGKDSGVCPETKSLLLEAAHFNAPAIRRSAFTHKVRTDAAAMFEKSLDPNQNTMALQRYCWLLDQAGIKYQTHGVIASIGQLAPTRTITVSQKKITKLLGVAIPEERVEKILTTIGFGVEVAYDTNDTVYTASVPSYRATKDITIPEDIVEEVGRFYGYTNIPLVLPERVMKPFSMHAVHKVQNIKHHCAYALGMHEVYNYAVYDQFFIDSLAIQAQSGVTLANPVSERWTTLVTSLIPHLLKNVKGNKSKAMGSQFFEWARTWSLHEQTIIEHKSLAGMHVFDKNKSVQECFYDVKEQLQSLFDSMHMTVRYKNQSDCCKEVPQWFASGAVACLMLNDEHLGYVGLIDQKYTDKCIAGNIVAWELQGDMILDHQPYTFAYVQPSKYQDVTLDVSMFAPYTVSVDALSDAIIESDGRITDVLLVDQFEKDSWGDKRALTIRFVVNDPEKTLEGSEIDAIAHKAHKAVQALGVEVR